MVAKPLPSNMPENDKRIILQNRKQLLSKVRNYINTYLNPAKVNLFDFKFIWNLFKFHLKRPANSCFVNNYFDIGLLPWDANMGIQSVFNHYKTVTYVCSHLSKPENDCSQAMNQAVKEAVENNLDMHTLLKENVLCNNQYIILCLNYDSGKYFQEWSMFILIYQSAWKWF